MNLTTYILEQYFFCPRSLYFREIKRISLYKPPYRKNTLLLRNKIQELTSNFFSRFTLPDERNHSIPLNRFISTGGFHSLECAFMGNETINEGDLELKEKVFTFLDFILNYLISRKGENSTFYPNKFILNPNLLSESLMLSANPSIIILNTDESLSWILQTYSMPYGLDEVNFFTKYHILLANNLKMSLRDVIVVDYRNMIVNTKIFGKKVIKRFESRILSFKNDIETNNYVKCSHNCQLCEFDLICKDHQE